MVEHPKKKVAIVTFENEVQYLGDGSGKPTTIRGQDLFNFEALLEIGQTLAKEGDTLMPLSPN